MLSWTKQVEKNTQAALHTRTYSVSHANTARHTADPAVILDQLPPGVTFGSTPNNGQLVNATPPSTGLFVRFNLGTVPIGASASAHFTVRINNNVAAGTPITNQAAINPPAMQQPIVSN